jgi:hypothetical protein
VNSLRQEFCSECNALWREYGDATTEHRKLVARAQGPAVGATGELRDAIEIAGGRRMAARDAIYLHVAHPFHRPVPPVEAPGA